ncbi:MAG: hypothetical protein ACQEWV_27075 [Bacillota bacterium]
MVNDVAKYVGIDRNEFGVHIHELKEVYGMSPKQNFSYEKLVEIAKEFKLYREKGGK